VGCIRKSEKVDFRYEGMDVYYNYHDYFPEDTYCNNLLSSDEILTNHSYSCAEYHCYVKNFWRSTFWQGFDYSVAIMALTYDEATYIDAKEAFFEEYAESYCRTVSFFSHNGYDFYESYGYKWSDTRNHLILHIFNDSKKEIILLTWNAYDGEPKRFSTFEESGDVMGFFEYFYGDFYDFDS
jgi:hypothetical protein